MYRCIRLGSGDVCNPALPNYRGITEDEGAQKKRWKGPLLSSSNGHILRKLEPFPHSKDPAYTKTKRQRHIFVIYDSGDTAARLSSRSPFSLAGPPPAIQVKKKRDCCPDERRSSLPVATPVAAPAPAWASAQSLHVELEAPSPHRCLRVLCRAPLIL